jgi:hypothetical protein
MTDNNKRDASRVDVLGALGGDVMIYQPMLIAQISKGGMQIETSFALQLDSLHDFRLTLGERSVVVKGRIVHCHISDVDQEIVQYRSGVEFIQASPHVASVIATFIEHLNAVRTASRDAGR